MLDCNRQGIEAKKPTPRKQRVSISALFKNKSYENAYGWHQYLLRDRYFQQLESSKLGKQDSEDYSTDCTVEFVQVNINRRAQINGADNMSSLQ